MGRLKVHSNGPLYRNTVIGTLAIDGWAVMFGTARKGLAPPSCTKCNSSPINGQCINFIYLMWHCNCICTLRVNKSWYCCCWWWTFSYPAASWQCIL